MTYEAYFDAIRSGQWEEEVLNVRAGRRKKLSVQGVTPSGTFSYRSAGNLTAHSGVIALDFDAQDNEEFPADQIAADPYVWALHRSISGKGWVVYIKIDPERHADAYLSLERHFANEYQVVADPSGKDVPRLRFVSYDPELYHNPAAKTWRKYLPKKQIMPVGRVYVHTDKDIEHCINQIRARGINLADSYHDWITIGMAFVAGYGEAGREYFHAVSSISSKYDHEKSDKKYSQLIRTASGKVTMASFFWLAQLAGVEIKTPRTTHIERVAKMQRRVVGKNGGHKDIEAAAEATKRVLDEMDDIRGEDVDQVTAQVMEMPESAIEGQPSEDLIADLKEFLRTYSMRFNEVTRLIEVDGEVLTDRLFNSVYIRAMEVLGTSAAKGKAITKDLLFSIIDSDFTPGYHPFRDFFSRHSNLKPTGEVSRLLSSLKVPPFEYEGRTVTGREYLEMYARKWLLSCVASWHGTYSVMMLVLTGGQMNRKTEFFRNLLPEELSSYYAESTLDKGKDDEILMCQKAIICDDEYEGKSKQDYKHLKSMLSRQTFSIRKPYGRISEDLQRIAVLCGTANEEEIINDPTGNRRIIPVPVEEIDWAIYQSVDKTALWMELYHEWKQIGDAWMMDKAQVKALNLLTRRNEQVSQEEEAIWMFFELPGNGGYGEFLTNTEIRNYIETNTRLKLSHTKLGLMLNKCGFEKKPKKLGGVTKMVYEVVKKRQSGAAGDDPAF